MKVVVAQLGARMHYAVPQILEKAGQLEHFYTDICAGKGWLRGIGLIPEGLRSSGLRRLTGRVPRGIPAGRMTAFTSFGLEYAWRLARARSIDERNSAFLWSGREFCRRVAERDFGAADTVYVFNSAGLEILQAAKRLGLRGILEQTIAPRAIEHALLRKETARFPEWERPIQESESIEDYCVREAVEWAAADVIVCGSEFVRDGVVACGGEAGKCVVVPYGLEQKGIIPSRRARRPGPLRVLTVGAVCLRKGAPHVLAAAGKMTGMAEFRWAGAVQMRPEAERQMRERVVLAGMVPRSEIAAHYAWADVFLLPSLCEGSATATYEALQQGLPVICTKETGSTVCDGEDGFIVPARDPGAIVEKLSLLANDPARLAAMSRRARQGSAEYSLEKYGARLLNALQEKAGVEA